MKHRLDNSNGFTLAEILITLVILGIVAGLAIPVYTGMAEKGRVNEAVVALNSIYMAQKVYALNNSGNYWNPGANPTPALINATLNVDFNLQYFSITSITANNGVNPKTFQAVAHRNIAGGIDYTIDQTGTITPAP